MRFTTPAFLFLLLALPVPAAAQIPIYQGHFDGSPAGDGRGRPRDVAVEPSGTILVVDAEGGCLHRFGSDGSPRGSLGGPGTEPGRFSIPTGVAVDAGGAIWVTEAGLHRVQKLTADGAPLLQLGGDSSTPGAAPGRFDGPTAVAVGGDGSIFVADAGNHRIQKFDPEGGHVASIGTRGAGPGEFHFPEDVWVHGGRLYVLDRGNLRVQVFDEHGIFVTAWGRSGADPGEFQDPTGLTVAPDGAVHVVDAAGFRVHVFSGDGAFLGSYGRLGRGDGDFLSPVAVVAAGGSFYVADADRRDVLLFQFTTAVEPASWGGVKLAFASGDRW